MPAFRRWFIAGVTAAMLGACSSSGDDPNHALTDMAETGDTCPLDLRGAMADAELEPGPDPVEVEVLEGSGEGDLAGPAIDRAKGVWVECTNSPSDGEVSMVLYAMDEGGQPTSFLLPLMTVNLELSHEEAEQVFNSVAETEEGALVDLPTDEPGALIPVNVGEAQSALLYVYASEATSEQAATIAETLADEV